ncbi:hypothetical protein GCM10010289_56810 [Streptomyces violascens]|uniref:Uncharacterized protein n=1 Tax=Streptomyces violascens TaxID=67381 RepID=A0ABQ3QW53_9ACTN|nr:hypothetical protein GCM10010289_56810 [Streptomyces violascens]GHI41512.1 hypothetical protein Sviol_59200 [Streptomyces violascens]
MLPAAGMDAARAMLWDSAAKAAVPPASCMNRRRLSSAMSGGLCKREGTGGREGCTKNTQGYGSPHVVTVTFRGTANEQAPHLACRTTCMSFSCAGDLCRAYAIQKNTAVIRLSSMVLPQ